MGNVVFGMFKPAPTKPISAPIEGPHMYLRAPRAKDWRAWAELRAASRAFLAPWEPRWPEDALSRAAFRRRLRRQAQDSRDAVGYSFFIFRRADDALVGGVTITNVRRGIAMSCSLGYWIGASYARTGLMTEALRSLLPFVFDTLGLHRVEAACLPANTASRRLLRRLEFREEGRARAYLRINGQWHDHLLFALLSSEFHKALDLDNR